MILERCTAWLAVLFLAAVLFSHTVSLRLLFMALGLAAAAVLAWRRRESIRPLPQIWLPFALWAAWALLSLFWSQEPERTSKELRNEVWYAAAGFWVCFVAAQTRGAARIMLPGFAVAATAVCGTALYNFALGWDRYLSGWHSGPGNFSSTVLVLMPCAIMAAWWARQSASAATARHLPLLFIVLFLVAGYTTQSRTLWLGFAAEITVCAFLLALRARNGNRRRVLAAGVFALAAATASVAMTAHVHLEREAVGAARAIAQDPRLVLWAEVVDTIRERPLLGYGFGRGILRTSLRDELKEPQLWHAHNLFLDTALQVGLPGVLLLLALLAAILREGWRMAGDPSPAAAACGIALLGIVVGMLVRNMTDFLFVRQNALLYWGVVGVLLAWGAKFRGAAR